MIRFACLQFRTQGTVALCGLVAVATVVGVSGPHIVHHYNTLLAPCRAEGDCAAAATAFLRTDNLLQAWLGVLVVVAPCLVGIFWGAPLVAAEMEAGTLPLVWTQSVTRSLWGQARCNRPHRTFQTPGLPPSRSKTRRESPLRPKF